ncbi:type II secretion system protein XpsH [Arenimonas sp. MALMAid1274]|uniref:type II secretion system protein XpsH n=1 Tax=Arenimonas sp. MALMAid1274 TaxID=3411630 RepID=UPI003B9ED8BE
MTRPRGFSLIELVVVLVLVATLAGLAAAVIGQALPGRQLRSTAAQVAGDLRFTRAQAIATGQAQEFTLDVAGKRWTGAGKRQGDVPADIDLDVTTARDPQSESEVAIVRFFPDGAATGGRIVLRYDEAAWRVDVAWLTGEVRLTRGAGQP